jgi:hypothetical protein
MRASVFSLVALLVCATPALSQQRDPIGPFVVDLHGVSGGLPSAEGWTPIVPSGTVVPSRGLGVGAGAHVYFGFGRAVTLGVGASYSLVEGKSTPEAETAPVVTTRATTLAPQVSFNFGHGLGWSYLSLGYGRASITSESEPVGSLPAAREESGWTGAINFGGGARWFIAEHFGVGFDARWHRLSARDATATTLPAPRATFFNLAIGVSIR